MTRVRHKDVLAAIRAAGYHGDKERGFVLYLENWVSLRSFQREFALGAEMRQNGVPCTCLECEESQAGIAQREPNRTEGPNRKLMAGRIAPLP